MEILCSLHYIGITVEPPKRILPEEDTIVITSQQRTHFKVSNVHLLIHIELDDLLTKDKMAGPDMYMYFDKKWSTVLLTRVQIQTNP